MEPEDQFDQQHTLAEHAGGDTANKFRDQVASAYFQSKQRFRKVMRRLPRKRRLLIRQHKGRKDTAHGHKKNTFLCCECSSWVDYHENEPGEPARTYLASKKGKGAGRSSRGNPLGPDGKRLKCHLCQSEMHLSRWCPQNKGRPSGPAPASEGKGRGKSSIHFADTTEAMNDNWWHSLLVRSGDEGLNTTMCGFVTAVPLMILGPQHEDQNWRRNSGLATVCKTHGCRTPRSMEA